MSDNTMQLLGEAFMKLHNVKNNHFCDSATVEDAVEFIKQRGTKVPDWMTQTSEQMSAKGTFLSNTEMLFISPETSGFEFPICVRWTSLRPNGVKVTGRKEKQVDGNKVVTTWTWASLETARSKESAMTDVSALEIILVSVSAFAIITCICLIVNSINSELEP